MLEDLKGFLESNGGSQICWIATIVGITVLILSFVFPDFVGFQMIRQHGGTAVNSFLLTVMGLAVCKYIMWRIKERENDKEKIKNLETKVENLEKQLAAKNGNQSNQNRQDKKTNLRDW